MKLHKTDEYFRTDHLETGMRRHSMRAGTVTLLSQGGLFAIGIISTMILARILRPDDFGLFAMATAIIALFLVLHDLGLATATVQRNELTQEIVSTLFWLNFLFGLLLTAAAAATAPLVAWFFQDNRLIPIALAIGGTAAIYALTVQHQALLRRQMRFTTIAFAEILSEALGITAGVVAAIHGADYWSLVILRLSASIVYAILIWTLCGWRPSFCFNYSSVRPMVAFGGFLTSTRIVRYVSRNFDRFLVGRFWDARVLGCYTRASDWLPGPINRLLIPIAGVAVSTLSRLIDQPERYRAYFRQGIRIVAILGTPVVCFFLLDARQIVLFLLGDQWLPTIPVLRCLAPAALATLAQMGLHWAFVSMGDAGRQFRWECFSLVIIVTGIFLGVRWGVHGVALGYSIASILLIPPGAWYCFRKTSLETGDLTGAFILPLAGSMIGMVCLAGIHLLFTPTAGNTIRLIFDATFFSVFYLISLPIIPGGRKAVTGWIDLLRDLRRS